MFQKCAILMILLILSAPFIALAQESSVIEEAKAAAIADAEKDVNKTSWFLMGCSLGVGGVFAATSNTPPVPVGMLVGKSAEYITVYTTNYQAKAMEIQRQSAISGTVVGTVTGVVVVVGCIWIALTAAEDLSDFNLFVVQ